MSVDIEDLGWFISQVCIPWWLSDKEPVCSVGDLGSILVLEDLLEKKMATPSSILVWEIPWTEEPCGLQSMGSQKNWT